MTRKEAILETATVLFAEKGFRNTSIGDIAKMIGVADGTVFYHYKTKEELFLAVLESFKAKLIEECQVFIAERHEESGLEMVLGFISFYIHLAAEMEERFLLLHRHYPYKLAENNPFCRKHLEDIYNCFIDIFEQAIVAGQKDGSIAKMPARKTAFIVFIMVDGLVRIGTYNLYQAGVLYTELSACCRRMLAGNEEACYRGPSSSGKCQEDKEMKGGEIK